MFQHESSKNPEYLYLQPSATPRPHKPKYFQRPWRFRPWEILQTHWISMQGWCVPDQCVPDRKFLDVGPLEQSVPWILCPWPMCPALDRVKHGTSSVGLRRLMDQWGIWPASPTPLTRFIGLALLRRMHAWPTHRTPPLRSAKALASWKPRDTLSKGCNIQEFSVGDTSVGDGQALHPEFLGQRMSTKPSDKSLDAFPL